MKIGIHHVTRYRYRRPVTLTEHRLMLFPRSGAELAVRDSRLTCAPDAALTWSEDVFGNVVGTALFAAPTDALVITSAVTVDQNAAAWPVFRITPGAHTYPFAYADADRLDLGALVTPRHADPDGRLKAWAEGFVLSRPTDTLSLLKDVNSGMLDAIFYRTRDEEGTQSPLETLALASGSCRDIAALLIEVARLLGFGARAVSGYLFDPDAAPHDPGSTHAWAEIFLPGAGWIAFDPTHRRVGSAGLIPTGIARCNEQIMPIQGGYLGGADDFLDMDVTVKVVMQG